MTFLTSRLCSGAYDNKKYLKIYGLLATKRREIGHLTGVNYTSAESALQSGTGHKENQMENSESVQICHCLKNKETKTEVSASTRNTTAFLYQLPLFLIQED